MYKGLYLQFAQEVLQGANLRVHTLAERLLANPMVGITEIIPGIVTLHIEFNPKQLSTQQLQVYLQRYLGNLRPSEGEGARLVDIPVQYDGEDLVEVAHRTGLTSEQVIARHAAPTYTVYLVGFSPGQPYLGDVDPSLRVPRRPSPRSRVPASSVVIANSLTTIGPFTQPTGWAVLGRALERIYDPHRVEPALLKPGDRVRFIPARGTAPSEPEALELLPAEPCHPFLKVLKPGLLDLIVDPGRSLAERFGLSRGGPLDSRSARYANALVGNSPQVPLIEINLTGPLLEALTSGVTVFAGWGMVPLINGVEVEAFESFALHKGDILSFRPRPPGIRGYLAVPGGIESKTFLGSVSVSLRGRIGRPLKAGDVLGLGHPRTARPGYTFKPPLFRLSDAVSLRIVPGPQASTEALERLAAGSFTVTSADRVGVRFEGPAVPGGEVISEAVPLGAIQVPPGGAPILLLNDRGTTGGYAKPALLYPKDLPLAGQLRPGTQVRFSLQQLREPLCQEVEFY